MKKPITHNNLIFDDSHEQYFCGRRIVENNVHMAARNFTILDMLLHHNGYFAGKNIFEVA